MIPHKLLSLIVIALVAIVGLCFTPQAEAGRFGLFGNSGCSSGNCSSSGYSTTETAVEPELASIAPHGVRWQLAESRTARRQQEVAITQQTRTSAASNLVLAYRSGKIDPAKSGRRFAVRR